MYFVLLFRARLESFFLPHPVRATLVSELVERGEKMLRDGLESPNPNPSKLNDSICAQLCVAGLEALTKATRYSCQLVLACLHDPVNYAFLVFRYLLLLTLHQTLFDCFSFW